MSLDQTDLGDKISWETNTLEDIAAFLQKPARGFLQQKSSTSLPVPRDVELAGAALGQPSLGGRQIRNVLHVPPPQRVAAETRVEFLSDL